MTTPKLSLSRMEEYCAKATPGPWHADGDYVVDTFDFHPRDSPEEAVAIVQFGKLRNSYFIANARTDLPALLSWAKRITETGTMLTQAMRLEFGSAVDKESDDPVFREVLALEKLLEECGE